MTAVSTYFTYYESPIGMIKIGGTDNYISEISFIDNKEQIEHGEPGISDVIHQCTEQLIEFFQGRRKVFDIAVHQEGTIFQNKVWQKLTTISYGSTNSYAELAKLLGDEKAVRVVAATIAKNKLNIIVPCHRVIGTSKQLTGYNGGLWRKKWLLQHEFRIKHGIQTLF
jgi:methylated-DNA-[protein]-cysteine S-methyltransferase